MFITVKGNKDNKLLVNTSEIKFIIPDYFKGKEVGCTIIFGNECLLQTNSTVTEIEQMIKESEDTE